MYRKVSIWTAISLALMMIISACGGSAGYSSGPTPGAAVVQPDAGAQPGAGRIAFISDRSGQVDVWLMDAAGTNPKQLTSDAARESNLQWSPNGRKLLYMSAADSKTSVFTLNADNGTTKEVYSSSEPLEVVWSAGSDAVLVKAVDSDSDERQAVYQVPLDGTAPRKVIAGNQNRLGSLSSGAGKVAVEVQSEETAGVFVGDPSAPSTSSPKSDSLIEGTRPVISPDGLMLAFYSPPMDDDPALFVRSLATGKEIALNADYAARRWDHGLAWAPDGKRLAFVRSTITWMNENGRPVPAVEEGQAQSGDAGIRIAAADGSIVRRITDDATDTSPTWSPDGTTIAFVSARDNREKSDVWVVSASGEGLKNLTKGQGNSWSPAWGPGK